MSVPEIIAESDLQDLQNEHPPMPVNPPKHSPPLLVLTLCELDVANLMPRLFTKFPDLDILYSRRSSGCSLPNDCLSPRTNEDSVPDSRAWDGELYRRMECIGENVE